MFNDHSAATAAPTDSDPTADDTVLEGQTTETPEAEDQASAEQLEQLLVLSQSPVSLEAALEQEAEREETQAPLTVGHLAARYVRLLGLVAGVAMVAGAVRHFSSDAKLYLGVAIGGALLFAIASTIAEPRAARGGKLGRIRFGAKSLVLGAGLGLLVGGLVHFSALPHTGAILVPLGVALSIGAFVARDGRHLVGRDLISAGITVAGLLVWLGVGLTFAAKKIDPPANAAGTPSVSAGGHDAAAGAGHGAATGDDHGAAAGDGHGGAAKPDAHGAPAAEDHGEKADAHGAKADAHGAKADAHGAAASDHAADAKSTSHDAPAADTHKAAAKPAAHDAAGTSHGEKADSHAGADSHAKAADEEDEVTAADVLVSRKSSTH